MAINLEKALQKAKRERTLARDHSPQLVNQGSNLEKALVKAKQEHNSAHGGNPQPEIQHSSLEATLSGPSYTDVQKVHLNGDILSANHCVCAIPDMPESSFYKVLRARIQQVTVKNNLKTIMLTSTTPDEGKTLTSINLAFSFSRAFDQTVLLVDADLKKQQIHKTLGVDSQYGVVDYLINRQPIKDCLVWPEGWKLVFVSGGQPVEDSSELLGSQLMNRFIKEAGERYQDRYVFLDAPPIMAGADAIALAPLVDGIIVVVRAGQTSIKQVRKAVDLLPPEKVIGLVLNGKKMGTLSLCPPYNV